MRWSFGQDAGGCVCAHQSTHTQRIAKNDEGRRFKLRRPHHETHTHNCLNDSSKKRKRAPGSYAVPARILAAVNAFCTAFWVGMH